MYEDALSGLQNQGIFDSSVSVTLHFNVIYKKTGTSRSFTGNNKDSNIWNPSSGSQPDWRVLLDRMSYLRPVMDKDDWKKAIFQIQIETR